MKILMLGSGTIHSSLSHRLLSLGTQLSIKGHEVTIVVPKRDKYSNYELDNPTTINGIKMIYPVMLNSRSSIFSMIPYILSSAYRVLITPTDAVYIVKPTPVSITGFVAKLFKRRAVFVDLDDLGSEVMRIEGYSRLMAGIVEACERLATNRATALVVASTLLESIYRNKYPLKPIIRLSNGVHCADFITSNRNGLPHIIFFGALNRERIVDPLLRALPSVIGLAGSRNVKVDIIGDGTAKDALESTVRSLNLTTNVKFHGWMSPGQVKQIARFGDIGICIMPQERTTAACSNQKIFQYQAMGLCVIATRVGDLSIYLKEGSAGVLLSSSEPKEISAAIAQLIIDSSQRLELAKLGQHLARTDFAWETLGSQLNAFVENYSHRVAIKSEMDLKV